MNSAPNHIDPHSQKKAPGSPPSQRQGSGVPILDSNLYKGTIRRAPVYVLEKLIDVGHPQAVECMAEINRRHPLRKGLKIKLHAFNKAIKLFYNKFSMQIDEEPDPLMWLQKKMLEALAKSERNQAGYYVWDGMKFAIYRENDMWVLVTVERLTVTDRNLK